MIHFCEMDKFKNEKPGVIFWRGVLYAKIFGSNMSADPCSFVLINMCVNIQIGRKTKKCMAFRSHSHLANGFFPMVISSFTDFALQ
jgi:hypothetical protein